MTDSEVDTAIHAAAKTLGAKFADIWDYHHAAAGEWVATGTVQLTEEIVESWEQRAKEDATE